MRRAGVLRGVRAHAARPSITPVPFCLPTVWVPAAGWATTVGSPWGSPDVGTCPEHRCGRPHATGCSAGMVTTEGPAGATNTPKRCAPAWIRVAQRNFGVHRCRTPVPRAPRRPSGREYSRYTGGRGNRLVSTQRGRPQCRITEPGRRGAMDMVGRDGTGDTTSLPAPYLQEAGGGRGRMRARGERYVRTMSRDVSGGVPIDLASLDKNLFFFTKALFT